MIKFALLFFLIPLLSFAKAGPEIEQPKVSYVEAVTLSQNSLQNSGCIIGQSNDYILYNLTYKKDSMAKSMYWSVTFIHPKYNDHTVTINVSNNKNVKVVKCTE